mmetsp:Transcript_35046/g.83098  ORF Transcript_35046/g.83098 Transcript_35046/m.83098 type:complete len:202 (+) Transcript_35046:715-1320(+)
MGPRGDHVGRDGVRRLCVGHIRQILARAPRPGYYDRPERAPRHAMARQNHLRRKGLGDHPREPSRPSQGRHSLGDAQGPEGGRGTCDRRARPAVPFRRFGAFARDQLPSADNSQLERRPLRRGGLVRHGVRHLLLRGHRHRELDAAQLVHRHSHPGFRGAKSSVRRGEPREDARGLPLEDWRRRRGGIGGEDVFALLGDGR